MIADLLKPFFIIADVAGGYFPAHIIAIYRNVPHYLPYSLLPQVRDVGLLLTSVGA